MCASMKFSYIVIINIALILPDCHRHLVQWVVIRHSISADCSGQVPGVSAGQSLSMLGAIFDIRTLRSEFKDRDGGVAHHFGHRAGRGNTNPFKQVIFSIIGIGQIDGAHIH